ncbi:hypothetical protein COOONC_27589 [Cooperia oncophora]
MILNASLFYEIPSVWKESIRTAIPKHPNATLVSSYRPISITTPVVKVLEKVIRDKLPTYFSKNRMIPIEQHGFVTGAAPDYFNGVLLKSTRKVRDLAIHINSELDFDRHISIIVKKVFGAMLTIFNNIHYNDAATFLKLYKAYVVPI